MTSARFKFPRGFLMLLILLAALGAQAQLVPAPIPLYSDKPVPGAQGNSPADRPVLYPFLPAARSSKTAVVIFPGGGYSFVALGKEGFQPARWLNAQGIAAFVVDYRVAPYRYPVPIEDGAQAVRLVRSRAAEFGIDPDKIGVWGFSAGGHLATTLSAECRLADAPNAGLAGIDCLPNFAILAYPVVSMEPPVAHPGSLLSLLGPSASPELARQLSPQYAVTAATPPTFDWATTGDPVVPSANSVLLYTALAAKGVPAELHMYDFANHGCGLCGDTPELAGWPLLLRAWMVRRNLVPPDAPPPPPPAPNDPDWPAGIDGPGHTH